MMINIEFHQGLDSIHLILKGHSQLLPKYDRLLWTLYISSQSEGERKKMEKTFLIKLYSVSCSRYTIPNVIIEYCSLYESLKKRVFPLVEYKRIIYQNQMHNVNIALNY